MIYTLKNRYKEPFTGMYDGELYEIRDQLAVPDFIALHLRNQSIIKDNPITGQREFSLGIVELRDDLSTLDELPIETLDRTDMDMSKVVYRQSGIRSAVPLHKDAGEREVHTSKERG